MARRKKPRPVVAPVEDWQTRWEREKEEQEERLRKEREKTP